jgi:hypothetical protein
MKHNHVLAVFSWTVGNCLDLLLEALLHAIEMYIGTLFGAALYANKSC